MCNAQAQAGLQIGGAIAGAVGGMSNTRSQNSAILRNNQTQMDAISAQYAENRAVTLNQMSQRAREALIEQSRLAALSADSGLTGNTESRLQRESAFNLGQDLALLQQNKDRTDQQIQRTAQGIVNNTQTRLSQVRQPDLVGAGLQIAGGYFDSQTTRKKLDAKAKGQ